MRVWKELTPNVLHRVIMITFLIQTLIQILYCVCMCAIVFSIFEKHKILIFFSFVWEKKLKKRKKREGKMEF